jgi:hypothetical protein
MKRLLVLLTTILMLVGLTGCGESFDKQGAEGTAYLAGLVSSIPNVKVRDARYVVTGPGTINHNIVIELETQSVDAAVISDLLTQAYRISVQTLDHESGTASSNFSVAVIDGTGTPHFGTEVGLKTYPSYQEVVEWLKSR